MFDWDKDYSDLVEGGRRGVDPEPRDNQSAQIDTVQDISDEHSARQLVLPLLIGVAFLIGLALEKGDVLQTLRTVNATPDMLALNELQLETQMSPAQPEVFGLPAGLKVYDKDQYRRFIRGLQGLSVSDLRALERANRADMRRAPEGLVPFFQDALFLLEREIAERGS